MTDRIDRLKTLHTRLIDSRDGYKASRERIEGEASFTGFFDSRIAERERYHTELHRQLHAEGVEVAESGSTAASAHRGWLKLRDAVTGDDEAVYDEIVTGEEALLEAFDAAIAATSGEAAYGFLSEQRAGVQKAIEEARAEKARHAA
jgi:uncharacterized protein (TIGR02284 family)